MGFGQMRNRDKRPYEERVSGFLEPGELVETILAGRPASFARIFYPFGRVTRQALLTDRNLYVLELEGSERRMSGTPSRVLSKHERGNAPARYRFFPPTLIVAGEEIRPAGRRMVMRAKPIAEAASASS
jgi:hypothetical protein